jgi:hypothetical protein
MRTFCTRIRDAGAEEVLAPYAEVFGRATRWSFREIHVRKQPLAAVKREAQRKFGITARQFNGVRFDLDQAVGAWKGTLDHRIATLSERIERVQEGIAGIERKLADPAPRRPLTRRRRERLEFTRHQKGRHLGTCRDRLTSLEAEAKAAVPRICFGGAERLRETMAAGEIWRWREKRSGRILLVGSSDETAGDQSCQWDGSRLTVKLPGSARGERMVREGVRFRYGQAEMEAALERKAAIAWLLFRDDAGAWQARASMKNHRPSW